MFAKSTITLFVLAVGLSSLLSGNSIGSASAHPRPDLSIEQKLGDGKDLRLFVYYYQQGKNHSLVDSLQNPIQGTNSNSENHLGSEVNLENVKVVGKLPKNYSFGAETYAEHNVIQQDNSTSITHLGSKLFAKDVVINFTN